MAEVRDVLDSIGDNCPECAPDKAASSALGSRPQNSVRGPYGR
jgi:hypothetical protein